MSMSQSPEDGFDEDLSDFDDFENPPPSAKRAKKGKAAKGKGKASNNNNNNNSPLFDDGNDTASTRKLQNRVAQREFRQRKLQYVKDLEARVEFLSSSKDDQLEALKAMLRGLLDENKQLRAMLQTVTTFVGDGIGGLSHKAGLKDYGDIDTFMEFVHRGDRKTLLAHYDTWKESKAAAASSTGAGAGNGGAGTSDQPAMSVDSNPDGEQQPAPASAAAPSKAKNGQGASGKRSQPSSRASSPANNASTNDSGLSRKRSRNDKTANVSSTTAAGGAAKAASSSQATKTSSSNPTLDNTAKAESTSSQPSPTSANPAKSTFDPSPLSTSTSNPQFPSIISNPPPADYAAYLNYMSSATAPNSTAASTSYDPSSYYGQMPNSNMNMGNPYNNNFGGYGDTQSGWNSRFGVQQANGSDNSNAAPGGGGGGANAFFFDTAEPMSMPTSSFTNEFLNQYIHTGLTPLLDPSFNNTMFPWSTGSNDPTLQSAPTPGSSTSSLHQMPSPANQSNNNTNNNQQNRNPASMQSQQQQPQGNFVPPLSLGQNPAQQALHQQQQQQQRPTLPPQIYNPLASPGSSLPSIPPGFSPDELINSNPLLAAIHIISFHLRNKAADPNYRLPPALESTPKQDATPHDRRLDGILHREWRTRLLSKLDYNMNELLQDLMQASTVHPGDNLLDPSNWELSETFLRKYKHTITPDVLTDSNKWRRSRGDPEITL